MFKERELVRKLVSQSPLVVEAVRTGWLLDMKSRNAEEYRQIIEQHQAIDYDDRESVKESAAFKTLTLGTVQATISQGLAIDTGLKTPMEQRASPSKSRAISPSHTPFATEIRNLRAEIVKLQEDVKKEKNVV